jgi:pyruvate kinase
MERRAKIMATLGPASASTEVIGRMLEAGLDVVRLNLSHGDHEEHRTLIRAVRQLAGELGRFVPIVLDLMGPRYRLGEVAGGSRVLADGQRVRLEAQEGEAPQTAGAAAGEASEGSALPIGNPDLLDHLRPGERLLIDNGLVELEIESAGAVAGGAVSARVVHGGRVSSRKGINLPDTSLPFLISAKDRADIAFAVEEAVDYVAASYVNRADDLEALQAVATEAGGRLPLIAKLERQGSIDRLAELVEAADAVMVARGDLGVEVPLYRVPVLQKEIIAAGRDRGKPVIVATQMLESMMTQPRPTRAEASDVANAVLDGADALMLSGETAAGSFPVGAVAVMARVIQEAEGFDRRQRGAGRGSRSFPVFGGDRPRGTSPLSIAEVVSAAAVYAAERLPVQRIVAFSQGGFTARMIARNRPEASILVFTTDPAVARRIQLVWGVRPRLMKAEVEHHDEVVEVVERQLLEAGLAKPGEAIVILMGDPIDKRPLTNLMRVHRLAEAG